ncbi:tissue factor pathway inhibitor a isoform X1 [Triplophysa dalaica]|uniref:tissue factor pathway inhibitor a isoform X1 n=1 Tax=Triplophysa dalaica TaxID=1582913 RepID=UPI0024E02F87|nr:tissue factor pathway inhibitor a isoform X1 [Triplophysa dalaica]
MAPLLDSSCTALLLLHLIGVCFTTFATADGVRSELHIFHHSCALKEDEGPCKAIKDRFYFNIDKGRCEVFEYGGCQGNANNFETLEECEQMCVVRENKSPCHLEDEPGPCRGLVPRYYFDSKSQECILFFYGGCFGNANNFKTIKECQARCHSDSKHKDLNAPSKPVEETKPAVEFIGKPDDAPLNVSHLQLQRESRVAALGAEFTPPPVCMSPIDRGDCHGSERRFVYNPRTGRCQMFRYSGCGGNKNNFVLKRHCLKMCTKERRRRQQIRIKTRNSNILHDSA